MRAGMVRLLSADISKAVKKPIHLSGIKLSLLVIFDFLTTLIVVNGFNVMSWRGVWELHGIWIKDLTEVNAFNNANL